MMTQSNVSRRRFIQTSSIGTTALLVGAQRAVSANDKLRLCMVGLGGRGTHLMRYCLRIPDYEFVALCDKRQERLDRAMGQCKEAGKDPKGYSNFAEMLEKEEMDAIIVATEVANHAECVIPALEAGINVFSEKPIESNVEKVDAVVRAARQAKGIFQVGFQRRYNPTFHTTIDVSQSDKFGKITFLQGHWYFNGAPGGWVKDVEMSGGKLVEQACHHMDVMTWVMGAHPSTCNAMGAVTVDHRDPPAHIAEDHSTLNFEFPNGVILSYTHFSLMPVPMCTEKLWVMKDDGLVDLAQGLLYPRRAKEGEEPERVAEATDFYFGEMQQLEHFANHIRNHETPLSNVETARLSTLTALMGHKAMYNWSQRKYEPSQITWKDLGSTTKPEKKIG